MHQSASVVMLVTQSEPEPLPSAALLREYAAIDPSLPARIADQFVAQSIHRRELEALVAQGSERRQNLGQMLTFTLASLGVTLAAVVGIWGNPVVASVLAVVAVGGPAAAFVLARTLGRRRREYDDV
jgi:uncharacterized membrane protein